VVQQRPPQVRVPQHHGLDVLQAARGRVAAEPERAVAEEAVPELERAALDAVEVDARAELAELDLHAALVVVALVAERVRAEDLGHGHGVAELRLALRDGLREDGLADGAVAEPRHAHVLALGVVAGLHDLRRRVHGGAMAGQPASSQLGGVQPVFKQEY
jgi:hypothetical protein